MTVAQKFGAKHLARVVLAAPVQRQRVWLSGAALSASGSLVKGVRLQLGRPTAMLRVAHLRHHPGPLGGNWVRHLPRFIHALGHHVHCIALAVAALILVLSVTLWHRAQTSWVGKADLPNAAQGHTTQCCHQQQLRSLRRPLSHVRRLSQRPQRRPCHQQTRRQLHIRWTRAWTWLRRRKSTIPLAALLSRPLPADSRWKRRLQLPRSKGVHARWRMHLQRQPGGGQRNTPSTSL